MLPSVTTVTPEQLDRPGVLRRTCTAGTAGMAGTAGTAGAEDKRRVGGLRGSVAANLHCVSAQCPGPDTLHILFSSSPPASE